MEKKDDVVVVMGLPAQLRGLEEPAVLVEIGECEKLVVMAQQV
jgi:hypothetical protein